VRLPFERCGLRIRVLLVASRELAFSREGFGVIRARRGDHERASERAYVRAYVRACVRASE